VKVGRAYGHCRHAEILALHDVEDPAVPINLGFIVIGVAPAISMTPRFGADLAAAFGARDGDRR
jgi:hypothetical protein